MPWPPTAPLTCAPQALLVTSKRAVATIILAATQAGLSDLSVDSAVLSSLNRKKLLAGE